MTTAAGFVWAVFSLVASLIIVFLVAGMFAHSAWIVFSLGWGVIG